jgi:hypothetical protein
MQFGLSASGDQGKAFGTVAGENGIQLAGAFPDFTLLSGEKSSRSCNLLFLQGL